ncbi:hypothetical protein NKR19_g6763 [Coniochaeta hoffmannii]|uniref:Ubiquitin-like domain-containing protein n=1 Tax=Coniochaeta hoffmannii TaxID=91930 RepID=A0AA38RCV8_9PEZI|nr:hypothetical protein NKR19_g6763 [Coniochaeta hoffmannii]
MLIKVRTLTGKEIELDIESDYKVAQIKEKVEEKEGIPPVQQRLIYGGKQMVDDKTAADYQLEGGATLHLVLALRGGRTLAVEGGEFVSVSRRSAEYDDGEEDDDYEDPMDLEDGSGSDGDEWVHGNEEEAQEQAEDVVMDTE